MFPGILGPVESRERRAMGQAENKAAVAAAYAAFGQGDVAAVVGMNAPDAVWIVHAAAGAPFEDEYVGHDAIGKLFGLLVDSIEIAHFEIEPIAAEGDIVVARGEQTYRVKSTGKSDTVQLIHIFTFGPDGKVTRFEEFEFSLDSAWS